MIRSYTVRLTDPLLAGAALMISAAPAAKTAGLSLGDNGLRHPNRQRQADSTGQRCKYYNLWLGWTVVGTG